jgi:hypothetical protein
LTFHFRGFVGLDFLETWRAMQVVAILYRNFPFHSKHKVMSKICTRADWDLFGSMIMVDF